MREDSLTILLTGASRSGKTTVCTKVIDLARAAGVTVGGIVTENAVTESGAVVQHVVDVRTGRRSLLATATAERARVVARYEGVERPLHADEFAASWVFDEGGVAFGNAALVATITTPCELLVVDQIGPLELRAGAGFDAAFDAVLRGRHEVALVVVHPLVLELAERRFPGRRQVFEVGADVRDGLPQTIMALCRRR